MKSSTRPSQATIAAALAKVEHEIDGVATRRTSLSRMFAARAAVRRQALKRVHSSRKPLA